MKFETQFHIASLSAMEFAKRHFVRRRNLWSSEFKNPKPLYESASESAMRLADVCGAEIFRPNYTRKNRRLALLYADFTLYLVLSFWCISVLWGQLLDVMFCVVMIGGAVQVRLFCRVFFCFLGCNCI